MKRSVYVILYQKTLFPTGVFDNWTANKRLTWHIPYKKNSVPDAKQCCRHVFYLSDRNGRGGIVLYAKEALIPRFFFWTIRSHRRDRHKVLNGKITVLPTDILENWIANKNSTYHFMCKNKQFKNQHICRRTHCS